MQNMITVYPLPVADFSAYPPSTDIFNPDIQFNDNSTGAAQWTWDFGDNTTSILTSPNHWYGDTGTYTVWLYVESSQGCLDSTSNLVEITPIFTFYVPSAFTPNADGTNDTFFPKGETIDPDNYVFRIFNRWGQEIYASHTPGEKWDGTHSTGNIAQEEVYVWVADMLDLNGEKHKFYGRVTLYR
jgi:gliding motility-associated-like protein